MAKTIREMAEEVRARGRYGDEHLLHVNKWELDYIEKATGIPLTTNPDTGQKEAFLPFLLPLLGGALLPAALGTTAGTLGAALAAGAGSGLGSLLAGADPEEALLSAVTGGIGAGVAPLLSGADAAAQAATQGVGDAAAQAVATAGDAALQTASTVLPDTVAATTAAAPGVQNMTQLATAVQPPIVPPTPPTGAISSVPMTGITAPGMTAPPMANTSVPMLGPEDVMAQNPVVGKVGITPMKPEAAAFMEENAPTMGDKIWASIKEKMSPMNMMMTAAMGSLGGGGEEDEPKKKRKNIPENFPSNPRTYKPTAPGYRPGVDPEHRYFGAGGPVGNVMKEKGGFGDPGPSTPATPRAPIQITPVDLSAFIPNYAPSGYSPPQTPNWASSLGQAYSSAFPPNQGSLSNQFSNMPPIGGMLPGAQPAPQTQPGVPNVPTMPMVPQVPAVTEDVTQSGSRQRGLGTGRVPPPWIQHGLPFKMMQDALPKSPSSDLMNSFRGRKSKERHYGFAEGGPVGDPNAVVEAAIAAIMGQGPPEAIQAFVAMFGEAALEDLISRLESGAISGEGGGMDDDVPAMIDGQQPAALSSGEHVIPADVVSHIGDGNTEAGSSRLDEMINRIRMEKTGNTEQPGKLPKGMIP